MTVEAAVGPVPAEEELLRVALELGATEVGGPLTAAELQVARNALRSGRPVPHTVDMLRAAIRCGGDPLGEALCQLRSPLQRRSVGAFYSPPAVVEPMVEWALRSGPKRLVDPGCGSGRFAAAAARRDPTLEIVAVDLDPVATILTRATLAALGSRHALVLQHDYTTLRLEPIAERTAFVGNPPYVRHHQLSPGRKAWATRAGLSLGCHVSGLAGLHVHFYLATAMHARPDDVGCLVTSSEWLDVGYGAAIRDLLVNGLGGQSLQVVNSRALTFDDAQTTAVVACFVVGSHPDAIRIRLVNSPAELSELDVGEPVPKEVFARAERWTALLKPATTEVVRQVGSVRLGSIARVHRGLVTGSNGFFVMTRVRARELGLEEWCRPAITEAREILEARGNVAYTPERKLLLDVPADVDRSLFPALDAYLRQGEALRINSPAVAQGYICRHRRPWWYLGKQTPPPIVASYMARQAPAFALNPDGLALINIGHGIYPRQEMGWAELQDLVCQLNSARDGFRGMGRTYQGGLEKFEPREMEALPVKQSHG
ncbi:MAG: methyltransferase [Chloroflexi bacterium]|nr:methyltransferase [Chloroflexota bacterium]